MKGDNGSHVIGQWESGQKIGLWTERRKDGSQVLQMWEAGVKSGIYQEIDDKGVVFRSGAYKDGALHGDLEIIHKDGKATRETWENGKKVEPAQ